MASIMDTLAALASKPRTETAEDAAAAEYAMINALRDCLGLRDLTSESDPPSALSIARFRSLPLSASEVAEQEASASAREASQARRRKAA